MRQGKDVAIRIDKTQCLTIGKSHCDDTQLEVLKILEERTITLVFFVQESYLDYNDFDEPIKK
jgi:hypothetical protein